MRSVWKDNLMCGFPETDAASVAVRSIFLQADVEHGLHSGPPLRNQSRGGKNQHAPYSARSDQWLEDQSGFNRLAKSDIVSDQPTNRPRARYLPAHPKLVRQQLDTRA